MNPVLDRIQPLPEALSELPALAMNLAWSWNRDARRLFELIDPTLWALGRHDPIQFLQDIEPERLMRCAEDPEILELYDSVVGAMRGLEDSAMVERRLYVRAE